MKKLTNIEMKSVRGGVMDLMGCSQVEADPEKLECCIHCGGHRRFCGDVMWYFTYGNNPDVCT
jgi:hypothetical protein